MANNLSGGNFLIGKHKNQESSEIYVNTKLQRKLTTSESVIDSNNICVNNSTLLPNILHNNSNVYKIGEYSSIPNVNTSTANTVTVHQCQFCNSMFANEILLASHICTALPNVESSVNSNPMLACNVPLSSGEQIKTDDIINHELKKKYEKILMQASTNDSNVIVEHMPQVKVSSPLSKLNKRVASVFQCPVCFQYFEDVANFTVHVAEDHSQYYQNLLHNKLKLPCNAVQKEIYFCTTCHKIFPSQEVYHTHYTLEATSGVHCILCDDKLLNNKTVLRHEISVHGRSNKNLYFEDLQLLQSSTYTTRTVLKMSVTKIVIEVYACSCCTNVFYTKQSMSKHLLQKHADLKYSVIKQYFKYKYVEHFVCNLCPQYSSEGVFKKVSECLLHCQVKHVSSVQDIVTSSANPVCDINTTSQNEMNKTQEETHSICQSVDNNILQAIKEENIDQEYTQISDTPEMIYIKSEPEEEGSRNLYSNDTSLHGDLDIPEMKIEVEENQLQEYYEESVASDISIKDVPQIHTEVPHILNVQSTATTSTSNQSNENPQQTNDSFQLENYCEVIKSKLNGVSVVVGKKVTKRVFMCLKCKVHFFDVKLLEVHTNAMHPDMFLQIDGVHAVTETMERWLCDLCRPGFKIFTIQLLYHNHLLTEHNIRGVEYQQAKYEYSDGMLIDKQTQTLIDATFKFVVSSNPIESQMIQPPPGVLNTPPLVPPNNLVLSQNSVISQTTVINQTPFNNPPQLASQNNLVLSQSVVDTNNILNQNQLVMTTHGLILVPNNQFQEHVNLMSNGLPNIPQFPAQHINPSINPIFNQVNPQPSMILPSIEKVSFPNSQIIMPPSPSTFNNVRSSIPQNNALLLQEYLKLDCANKNSRLRKIAPINSINRNSNQAYIEMQDTSVAILTKNGLQRIEVNSNNTFRNVNDSIKPLTVPKLVNSIVHKNKPGTSVLKKSVQRSVPRILARKGPTLIELSSDDDTSDVLLVNDVESSQISMDSIIVDDNSSNTNISTAKKYIDVNGPNFAEIAIKQNMTFECCYCKKMLFSEKQYVAHKDQCHENILQVIKYKVQIDRYTCSYCQVYFDNQDNCASHININHKDCESKQTMKQVDMYRCPNCLKCLVSPLKLQYHMDACKYPIVTEKSVIKCIKNNHYSCCICKDWFVKAVKLKAHIKESHPQIEDYITVQEYGTHLWSCTICPINLNKCFVTVDLCNKHLLDIHEVFLTTEEVDFLRTFINANDVNTIDNESLESALGSVIPHSPSDPDILKCPKLSQRPVVRLERITVSESE